MAGLEAWRVVQRALRAVLPAAAVAAAVLLVMANDVRITWLVLISAAWAYNLVSLVDAWLTRRLAVGANWPEADVRFSTENVLTEAGAVLAQTCLLGTAIIAAALPTLYWLIAPLFVAAAGVFVAQAALRRHWRGRRLLLGGGEQHVKRPAENGALATAGLLAILLWVGMDEEQARGVAVAAVALVAVVARVISPIVDWWRTRALKGKPYRK